MCCIAVLAQYFSRCDYVVGVLQDLHNTSAVLATEVVLQYLHNTSTEVATVVVLHDRTTLEMLPLWLLYCSTCTIVQQL